MTIPRVRITEVCDIVAGQAPNSKTYNENGRGTLFVRAGDYGSLYPSSKTYTTQPIAFGKEGDVFLCVVGATSGKVNLGINASITRSIFALRPTKRVLQKYLYYYLKSIYETLNYMKSGSAQGIINKRTLDQVAIPLPTISQQKEIG